MSDQTQNQIIELRRQRDQAQQESAELRVMLGAAYQELRRLGADSVPLQSARATTGERNMEISDHRRERGLFSASSVGTDPSEPHDFETVHDGNLCIYCGEERMHPVHAFHYDPAPADRFVEQTQYARDPAPAEPSEALEEVICDLPYLFGRASKEGHESGQRLAVEIQEKLRSISQPVPAVPDGFVLVPNETMWNAQIYLRTIVKLGNEQSVIAASQLLDDMDFLFDPCVEK